VLCVSSEVNYKGLRILYASEFVRYFKLKVKIHAACGLANI